MCPVSLFLPPISCLKPHCELLIPSSLSLLIHAALYFWVTAVDKHWGTAPSAAAATPLLMFTRGTSHEKERKLCGNGSLAAAHGPRHSKERWGCCLSICRSVWHGRESPQVAPIAKSPLFCSPTPPRVSIAQWICWLYSQAELTHTHTHLSQHWLSISLHLECENEEVGATEMISLKIHQRSGRVPGISASRFAAKSSKNSAKTWRAL